MHLVTVVKIAMRSLSQVIPGSTTESGERRSSTSHERGKLLKLMLKRNHCVLVFAKDIVLTKPHQMQQWFWVTKSSDLPSDGINAVAWPAFRVPGPLTGDPGRQLGTFPSGFLSLGWVLACHLPGGFPWGGQAPARTHVYCKVQAWAFPSFAADPLDVLQLLTQAFPPDFLLLTRVFSLWFPSRWASRSTTTQRRKDRLRQHSEHIGLDNDMREVGGLIWGQHRLWSRRWRFGQQCAYSLGRFCGYCKVWLGRSGHLDAAPRVTDVLQLQSTQRK